MSKKKNQAIENQRIISEIISGVIIFNFQKKTYIINEASLISKNISDKIYEEKLDEAKKMGLMTESQIIDYMIENKLWFSIA